MVNDPIADMLTRIRNGYRAGRKTITVPYSKLKHQLADIIVANDYLAVATHDAQARMLQLQLRYNDKKSAVEHIQRISKPGLRKYVSYKTIPQVLGGRGMVVLSTPHGLLTGDQAKKQNTGGEILCEIW